MGRGALLGSKCMRIKASYVQARRFIDFHTLILNSYFVINRLYTMKCQRGKTAASTALLRFHCLDQCY